ncbi:hypothetical protein R1sor_018092 [Riccia sorocarpa]|uniref:Uncharacterized protein n=1 Tax=Riccia sorocarpa TaxID=122646 RepID=A0ABD3ICF6_9MARC
MASQQGDGAHASVKRKGQDVEETHPVAPPNEGDGVGNTEATFTELVGEADAMAEEVVFFDVTVRQYGVGVEENDIVDTQWHIARTSGNSPSCRARF